jgi:hypothetical protein
VTEHRTIAFAALCAATVSGGNAAAPSLDISPREAMRDFVIAIAEQARSAASGFFTIPQNELELLTIDGYPNSDLAAEYLAVLDGVGQEALSFGYTADDVSTPQENHERPLAFLDRVKHPGALVRPQRPLSPQPGALRRSTRAGDGDRCHQLRRGRARRMV